MKHITLMTFFVSAAHLISLNGMDDTVPVQPKWEDGILQKSADEVHKQVSLRLDFCLESLNITQKEIDKHAEISMGDIEKVLFKGESPTVSIKNDFEQKKQFFTQLTEYIRKINESSWEAIRLLQERPDAIPNDSQRLKTMSGLFGASASYNKSLESNSNALSMMAALVERMKNIESKDC